MVANGFKGGGRAVRSTDAEQSPEGASVDQKSLADGAEAMPRDFSRDRKPGDGSEPGSWFRHYADEIETGNARPDPDMVRRFRDGEENLTPALVYVDRQGKTRAANEESARMIASANAAGRGQRLNTLELPNDRRQLAIARSMQRLQPATFGRSYSGELSATRKGGLGLKNPYSSEISGGTTRASQREIDRIARNVRRNGNRPWLPVPVRVVGDRYEVIGDATALAIARRANVRPWIYAVE